jgi:hypothetical protein
VTRRKRERFLDVAAIDRAATAVVVRADLTAFEHRVWASVRALTLSYSKLGDWLTLAQIAEAAGLPTERVDDDRLTASRYVRKRVRDALQRLVTAGVIAYEPSRGRGASARITIIVAAENGTTHGGPFQHLPTTAKGTKNGAVSARKGPHGGRERDHEHQGKRPTRGRSPKEFSEGGSAAPSAGAPGASPTADGVDVERAFVAAVDYDEDLFG